MNRTLRLLCTLLVILLAIPAMQARACAPLPVAKAAASMDNAAHHAMGHHGMSHGDQEREAPTPASVHHDCIGCIAPIDRDFYRPAATPLVASTRHADAAEMPFRLYRTGAPEPPPPRHTV